MFLVCREENQSSTHTSMERTEDLNSSQTGPRLGGGHSTFSQTAVLPSGDFQPENPFLRLNFENKWSVSSLDRTDQTCTKTKTKGKITTGLFLLHGRPIFSVSSCAFLFYVASKGNSWDFESKGWISGASLWNYYLEIQPGRLCICLSFNFFYLDFLKSK